MRPSTPHPTRHSAHHGSTRMIVATTLGVLLLGGVGFALWINRGPAAAPTPEAVQGVDVPMPIVSDAEKAQKYPVAKELEGISGYINSPSADGGDVPFRLADWVGRRVIMLYFWSSECHNCKRMQPYVNAWHDRYKEKGLLTIGIHSPEFVWERDYSKVSSAVRDERMTYPVVVDSDFKTWDAYENKYWPRIYLIDTDGYIVYDHIGEDAYLETETKIRELLIEHAQKRSNPLPILEMIPTESPAGDAVREANDPGYRTRP